MASSVEGPKSARRLQIDRLACSVCETCATACPPHALYVTRTETIEEILFDASLCDGCGGSPLCSESCPEKALSVIPVPSDSVPQGPVALIVGELADCQACGTVFVAEAKLQSLLEEDRTLPKSVQQLCPACRRERLLDSYVRITGKTS
ncbi:MAG: hypothetical protein GXX84_06040 [Acidobacteria bacterium]|nr:hypothetical protein [Acidobacteriota bacterium]